MLSRTIVLLAAMSFASGAPAPQTSGFGNFLGSLLAGLPTPSGGQQQGMDVIGMIGSMMGMVTSPLLAPFLGPLGIGNVAAGEFDITATLCKTFQDGGTLANMIQSFAGSPIGKNPGEECVKDTGGGSGPYKANMVEDPSLANHTIYAPASPPADKLPIIAFANGFCLPTGTMFANYLLEIASYGFFVIANGPIKPTNLGATTRTPELIKSIDWATQSPEAKKYGNLETNNIAVAGQSCGGLNAIGASGDPRVNLTLILNSGDFDSSGAKYLAALKTPIAWFQGGANDFAEPLGRRDYNNIKTAPALFSSVDVGHIGTYYQKSGGKFGKATTLFLRWRMKNDKTLQSEFCGASADGAVKRLGFSIQHKNGMCP